MLRKKNINYFFNILGSFMEMRIFCERSSMDN